MIGREAELKQLKSLKNEEEPQFIAVYGRRIGKTYLIRESFEYEFTFQHTGVGNNEKKSTETQKQEQMDKFRKSLSEAGYDCSERLTSWAEAFNGLKEVIKR